MKCIRCGAIMTYEKFYHETEQFWSWKCILCGEYIDQVIWENRQFQKSNRDKNRKKKTEPAHRSHSGPPSV